MSADCVIPQYQASSGGGATNKQIGEWGELVPRPASQWPLELTRGTLGKWGDQSPTHCSGSTGKALVTLASTENSYKGTLRIRPKVIVQHPLSGSFGLLDYFPWLHSPSLEKGHFPLALPCTDDFFHSAEHIVVFLPHLLLPKYLFIFLSQKMLVSWLVRT